MGLKKNIMTFDNNELFVSRRVLQFVLDNASKTILNDDFKKAIKAFETEFDLGQDLDKTYPIDSFLKFINICRKANASTDQFYSIGNKTHELPILVSSYFNPNITRLIDWKQQINLMKITITESNNVLAVDVELSKIIFIDHKDFVAPILNILRGFFDRMFIIFFGCKPNESELLNGFSFNYRRSKVTKFDLIRFIDNEEFVFSRVKNFLNQDVSESITENIYYYLFRDIKFSIDEIASKLNLSVRSLQRTLKDEGINFRTIKENVRKELSVRYLQDKSLLIQDIGLLLGYSERGAFEKAFKKWYGKNPNEYKKKLI